MMKEMGCKQNWGAVAPARLVSTRKSSTSPRLETILEEGCENHAAFTKKILLYLPVVLSTVFYFLVYNGVTPVGALGPVHRCFFNARWNVQRRNNIYVQQSLLNGPSVLLLLYRAFENFKS
ncbi:hypothetical protein GQ457_14G008240 [Hibiscus cannabinus]